MARRQPLTRFAGAVAALGLLASACGYHSDPNVVHLSDPGNCVAVDVAAASPAASLLDDAASRFNGSRDARLVNGRCVFVRVEAVDSPVALQQLLAGWPDTRRFGPAPVAWVPGSTMWGELLDARLAARHRAAIAPNGTPIAHTPLVVAMPAPMARALGYPRRPVSWADLARLARDGRGWGEFGHPEWGPFRFGRGNPNWSTTGLDATIGLDATATPAVANALERSVVYYGDTTRAYFDNWRRLAKKSPTSALRYLSAAVSDERAVVAYNSGHEQDDVALTGHSTRARLPLVAIYPADATIDSDNPLIVLRAAWTAGPARAGAQSFAQFLLRPAQQADVAAAGFRPARGRPRADLLSPSNGVDPAVTPRAVAPATPGSIERALTRWQAARRPARVLVLFDVSSSMGDPAEDVHRPGAVVPIPTKLARAQAALAAALDQLAPGDEIALRIFSTGFANHPKSDWRDIVSRGALATRRPALRSAIASLTPLAGSPLYAATRAAYDEIAHRADAQHIDAVVVVTDGYNEDDRDNNRRALLAHLAANPAVRVFPLVYSADADLETLQQMAEATNAWYYDARDTRDATDQLARLLASL